MIDPDTGIHKSVYRNLQPRNAALKAASEGFIEIILRETNSANNNRISKLHRYIGMINPVKWVLPLPQWKLELEYRRTGRRIPDLLNIKGNELFLEKKGYEIPILLKPSVKKIGTIDVPNVPGKDMFESVTDVLRTLPKIGVMQKYHQPFLS